MEEDEFFPKVEKALGDERLEELGSELEQAFEQAREETSARRCTTTSSRLSPAR